jgi:hypothetical protein
MTLDELGSRYERLRRELAEAYASPDWPSEFIDQLATEISIVERAMAGSRAAREMVPAVRIERTTFRLQGGCSTN